MNRYTKRAMRVLALACVCLASSGCIFWQLTAERLVAYHPVDSLVTYSVRIGDRLYFKTGGFGSGVQRVGILDISDPFELTEVDAPGLSYFPAMEFERIAAYGEFVIVTGGPQIFVYDSVNSTGEFRNELEFHDTSDWETRCLVHGDHFIRIINAESDDLVVKIYDMADLIAGGEPVEISSLTLAGSRVSAATAAATSGDLLYIATPSTFHIVDLGNVAGPTEISTCPVSGLAPAGNHLQVVDDTVYVLPGDAYSPDWGGEEPGDVVAIDVNDRSAPQVVGRVEAVQAPCAISGSYLLTRSGESIDVYDLTDFGSCEFVRTLNVRLQASAIHPVEDYAIVPEARLYRANGVGTVLIAPYR